MITVFFGGWRRRARLMAAGLCALAISCSGAIDPGAGGPAGVTGTGAAKEKEKEKEVTDVGSGALSQTGTPAGQIPGTPAPGGGGAGGMMVLVPPPANEPASPLGQGLRRLTNIEYENTVKDLFNMTSSDAAYARNLVPEERVDGYDNAVAALSVTPLMGEQYAAFAAKLATDNISRAVAGVSCAAGTPEETCATSFIRTFGKRAFRRPLADDEIQRLLPLYRDEKPRSNHQGGLRLVLEAMLQSPQFLYRVERGTPAGKGLRALGPYEVASALSYFLWSAPPDSMLMAAADADMLSTPALVEAHARRLLASTRAQPPVRSFLLQWLGIYDLDQIVKEPGLSGELLRDIPFEVHKFIDQILWKEDGSLTTLLTTPRTYMNARLQVIYGLSGFKDDNLVLSPLDPMLRAGLVTMSGVLMKHSKPKDSFPIARGKLVRERFFCQDLPSPPQNVNVQPPPESKTMTTRGRFAAHSKDPACVGCHILIDPIGFAFERYDQVGRYRATENGIAVDDSGMLTGTDTDGPFHGPVELAKRMAGSAQVQGCFATQMFRYAYGRREAAVDKDVLATLVKDFQGAKLDVRELVIALVRSDRFLRRPVE